MKINKLNLRGIRMIRMNEALALRGASEPADYAVSFKRFRKPTSGETHTLG